MIERKGVRSLRITLVSRSLTRGGAQVQVATLAEGLATRGHAVNVATFYSGGPLEDRIASSGVPVVDLGKSSRWNLLAPLHRLISHLRTTECDVAYAFLPMENLLGLFAARLSGTPIVWGIRGAAVNRDQYGLASRILYGLQFKLMRWPNAVISNSNAALDELNVTGQASVFAVPNGIDCSRFSPQSELRREFRNRYKVSSATPLVGIVARLDPMKDHLTFLQAARAVKENLPSVHFVIAGDGPAEYRLELQTAATDLGLASHILWLGDVADPVAVYNGLDAAVSSSAYGEGFSNSVGEAMACGLSVVVTNVGDSARIVGTLGKVVAPRAPAALAGAIIESLQSDTVELREQRRARIVDEFSPDAMVTRTESILSRVAASRMQ